jgi:HAD superfamily hydrolase (TIGR01509 family)
MKPDIAIGFDFDHTLGVDNRLEKSTALDMLRQLALKDGTTYAEADADAAIDAALVSYRSGAVPSLEGAIAGFFERFVTGRELLDECAKFREQVLERAPAHVQVLPGVAELLAELEALGIRYALLTNGWSPLQEEKARLIGFREPVYVSERIGARKPAREAFEVLAKVLDVPFERLWYIGDDPETDCAGAKALGITSVWFDWENKTYPESVARPDYVIHKLDELPPLVQGYLKDTAKLAE